MPSLGALSQAWVSAEASLPLGWQISGLWRFDGLWVALSEGPDDDYLSGCGQYADEALRRLSGRPRERCGMRMLFHWFLLGHYPQFPRATSRHAPYSRELRRSRLT